MRIGTNVAGAVRVYFPAFVGLGEVTAVEVGRGVLLGVRVSTHLNGGLALIERLLELEGAFLLHDIEGHVQIFCCEHVRRVNIKRLLRLLLLSAQESRQVPSGLDLSLRLDFLRLSTEQRCNCLRNDALLLRHLLAHYLLAHRVGDR